MQTGLHRQAGRPPFGQAVFQSARREAMRPERRDRFVG